MYYLIDSKIVDGLLESLLVFLNIEIIFIFQQLNFADPLLSLSGELAFSGLHFGASQLFMDPRIAWCTPEQLGPAYKHWLRIWESCRTTPGHDNKHCLIHYQHDGEMVENQNSDPNRINFGRQEDFIPLNWQPGKSVSRRAGIHRNPSIHGPNASDVNNLSVNIASTYELNHSKNLEILENHRYIPWVIADKKYSEHTIMW